MFEETRLSQTWDRKWWFVGGFGSDEGRSCNFTRGFMRASNSGQPGCPGTYAIAVVNVEHPKVPRVA